MCSISGFLSDKPLSPQTAELLSRALLYYGRERGQQSAGAYVNGKLLKRAMDPLAFYETEEFSALFSAPTSYALLHTRQPTCGGTGDDQAQPFVYGSTVTVHNGWYWNIKDLREEFSLKKPSGVDSELVTRYVHSYGAKSLPKFLTHSEGTSAVAARWNDETYLMRDGNPLSVAHIVLHDKTRLAVFGSTGDMVLNSIRYCWLCHDVVTKTLTDGILYRLTPNKLRRLTKVPIFGQTRSWTRYKGDWGLPGDGWDAPLSNREIDRAEFFRERAYVKDKDGVWRQKGSRWSE